MKKAFLLLLITASVTLSAQVTNTNISNYTYWDTEPFIAINPANPNNLIAAWMRATAVGQISIATKYSMDGGSTWNGLVTLPHPSNSFTQADVSIAFNSSGVAYLSYVDYKLTLDSGYVFCVSSADGGVSWSSRHLVTDAMESADLPVDRPWIACDRSGGANDGHLYIAMKSYEFGAMPHHVWMKSSSDGGLTWSSAILIDNAVPSDLVTNAMGAVAVGDDGAVYVAYPSWHLAASLYARMMVVKSTDGGSTFTPYVIGNATSTSAITDSLLQGSFSLQTNPMNAAQLVLVFTDNRNGDADILSTNSVDGGVTWSAPIRVTDDAMTNGNQQDMCWATYSDNGIFVTAWRDRRNTAGGSQDNFEIFATASSDNGATYGMDQNLSSAQSPFVNIVKGNDFIGVCSDGVTVFTDWCDNRTGNTEIFTAKIPLTSIMNVKEVIAKDLQLNIYPIPLGSANELNYSIQCNKNLEAELVILTIDGKTALVRKNISILNGTANGKIEVPDLTNGVYLLQVRSNEGVVISSSVFQK